MRNRKIFVVFLIVFTVMLSSFAFYGWQIIYTPNVLVDAPAERYFPIPKGTTFSELQNSLYDQGIVNDLVSFSFLAKLKKYDRLIKPGMYLLRPNMTNLETINMLRAGEQIPVKLTFSSTRKIENVPGILSRNMAYDSLEMSAVLMQDSTAQYFGFDSLNFISMFIPNTYEVYWTETPIQILNRLKREYDRFWTSTRKEKAARLNLSPREVSVLASIVQAEVSKAEEAPRVAGLYLNRLAEGMPLQADPTLVFAANDFTIRRVLTVHTQIESPYNTYKYAGLPPGPINMPTIQSLEAVLDAESHDYLYMCARDDFSGYHAFATNLRDHNVNARKFQQALDLQRIYR